MNHLQSSSRALRHEGAKGKAAGLCRSLVLAALVVGLGGVGAARAEQTIPDELKGIEIEEKLGAQVPLDGEFVDETGKTVKLGDYFTAGRPVILALNYYGCPTLCSLVLNGLNDGMRGLEFTAGKQFQVVALSINPHEKPELASKKREAYLAALGRPLEAGAWPFLTGKQDAIAKVAKAVGFNYRWVPESQQYAHAAGIFLLTPTGRLSRTLYGITFAPRDLRIGLAEASQGGISSPVDRLLLFCYHYDPDKKRYGINPMFIMRVGGSLTAVLLGSFLFFAWRRDRRASVNV